MQFAMRESSKRPSMAFLLFTRPARRTRLARARAFARDLARASRSPRARADRDRRRSSRISPGRSSAPTAATRVRRLGDRRVHATRVPRRARVGVAPAARARLVRASRARVSSAPATTRSTGRCSRRAARRPDRHARALGHVRLGRDASRFDPRAARRLAGCRRARLRADRRRSRSSRGSQWHSFLVTPFRVGFVRDRFGAPERPRLRVVRALGAHAACVWQGASRPRQESTRGDLADAVLEALALNDEKLAARLDRSCVPRRAPAASARGARARRLRARRRRRAAADRGDERRLRARVRRRARRAARGLVRAAGRDATSTRCSQPRAASSRRPAASCSRSRPREQVRDSRLATERTGLAVPLGAHAVALCPETRRGERADGGARARAPVRRGARRRPRVDHEPDGRLRRALLRSGESPHPARARGRRFSAPSRERRRAELARARTRAARCARLADPRRERQSSASCSSADSISAGSAPGTCTRAIRWVMPSVSR